MEEIYLFNTLNKEKENFRPLKSGVVGMYHCGPTVYDRQHIGNLRAAVIWDVLRRVFEFNGYKVEQIINITDFGHLTSDADEGEDKMARGLKRENLPLTLEAMKSLAKKYADIYFEDREKLNTLEPTHFPFASDHIKEDIELIKKLEEKGFVYKIDDGLYFDTSKVKNYGKLRQKENTEENKESRVKTNPKKKDDKDFVLWKIDKNLGWESPWGKGFPGWHIECSAISMKYLGETFDIHTGGIEHIPIHHTNEIAQSESATGKPLARFFLHNEHLILPGGKMAKSSGNTITLKDVGDGDFEASALRLLFLQAHYRSPIMYSWDALKASQTALLKIRNFINETKSKGKIILPFVEEFKEAINDDLDTPKALSILWSVLRDDNFEKKDRKATVLEFDKVLGLGLSKKQKEIEIPDEIMALTQEREEARKNKDFAKADEIRKKINQAGFQVNDTDEGPIII